MAISPEELLRELLERSGRSVVPEGLLGGLFAQQLAFVRDKSKFKSAVCSRRAGKSHALATYLILECLLNGAANCIYGALTRASAKKVIWSLLKKLTRQFDLGCTFNETELTCTFPNGSVIYCVGLNDVVAAESLRGMALRLAVLDESQSYGAHITYVIEDIITPALIDFNGTLCLVGTPNASCTGPFFDATTGVDQSYTIHKWTLLDNPHIKHAALWLENYRKKKGWSLNNPQYLREYCGVWIKTDNDLVYRFDKSRNIAPFDKAPHWQYILGVDLGYNDATALTVLAFSEQSPNLHVVSTYKRTQLIVSEVVDVVRDFQDRYNPVATVCDTGGLGKTIVEEMRRRHGISIKAAEKSKKFEYIELVNSDFYEGKILIDPELREIRNELEMLQWDEDRKKEDSRYENHLCDSFLYAWRESTHWGYRAKTDEPKFNTEAYWEKEMRELAEKLTQESDKPWWEK